MPSLPRRALLTMLLALAPALLLVLLVRQPMFDPLLRQMLYPAPAVEVASPPAGMREVELPIGDGEAALAWAGGGGAAGRPLALLFHGNGENLETMRQAGLFPELARLGVPWLAVDYPGYGRSGGAPSEESLLAAAEAALAWAEAEHPGRPVVACGWSLGAAVAVQLAARHPRRLAGLGLLEPWTRLSDVAVRHFPLPFLHSRLAGHYDSLAVAPELDLPVLVVHGARDAIIPVEQGERLAAAFPGGARWVRVDSAGHNDLLSHPIVWQELARFFASLDSPRL